MLIRRSGASIVSCRTSPRSSLLSLVCVPAPDRAQLVPRHAIGLRRRSGNGGRQAGGRGRARAAAVAAAPPPESRAWQSRGRDGEVRRRAAEELRPRAADRRREDRRGRAAQGRTAGPVVALRADMDGLPVREETNLPFASKATADCEGQQGRRDARVRARHARRDPARDRPRAHAR